MDDFDKKLKRNINDVKRGIKNLLKMNLKIEIQEVENVMGQDVSNVYVVDYMGDRVCLQKHLFTI